MTTTPTNLKSLAATLQLQSKGTHSLIRNLIINGFFDTPKTTGEIIVEVRQIVGKRLRSNIIQTYMRKFMESGIIYCFRETPYNGNFWVLASVDKTQARQSARRSLGAGEGPSSLNVPDILSVPAHPILQVTRTKILFLAANPTGMDPLALDKESREIEDKIRASDHRDAFELVTKWAVRTGDLLQYLNQHRAHIIHFSGHGSDSDELILADGNDNPLPVSKAALRQLFTTLKDNIRVVVLNACFSQPQAEAITEVVDCAVGMRSEIGDDAAIVFAAAFYQALGFGRSLKAAFDSGVTALMLNGTPEQNAPQLLVRKGVDASRMFLSGK